MSFDISRLTFDPWKSYAGVVMEQGRVQTDADWNEWLSELSRRIQAGTLDIMGHAVYPLTTPNAFKIDASSSGGTNTIRIGLGRMYVDGILVENHGPETNPPWDSALAELSNTPQPQPSTPQTLDASNSIDFGDQPYNDHQKVPQGAGDYIAYLDVWQRPVTYIEDSSLIDPAIGVDTTGRLQTVWRVGLLPLAADTIAGKVESGTFNAGDPVTQANSGATGVVVGFTSAGGPMFLTDLTGTATSSDTWSNSSGAVFQPNAASEPSSWGCSTSDYSLPWPVSSGTLTTQPVSMPMTGPCCLTTGSGYTGPENQLYRIEIQTSGGASGAGATFKWSRENASVQTSVSAIGAASNSEGTPASSLTVQSLGRDQVLGFQANNWIEITDESHDDACLPGELYKIDRVDVPSSSIILTTQLSSNFSATSLSNNAYTRIIRWDQAGQVYEVVSGKQQPYLNLDGTTSGGVLNGSLGIPIPSDGSPVVLENGIAISFGLSPANGSYQPMNFWSFTARTMDGEIGPLNNAPPVGIAHHYTKLGTVTFSASGSGGSTDCRNPWPPQSRSSECGCCCTVTVGDNKNSFGQFTSIQTAIDSLTHGGDVSILCGDFYGPVLIKGKRNVSIHGCGERTRVYSPSLQPGAGATPATGGSTAIDVPAVFSIAKSWNITLSSLTVICDDGSVGVLMDHLPIPPGGDKGYLPYIDAISNLDVTLSELTISASTMPAITALAADKLEICKNQIRMKDAESRYPAVYLAGRHIRFERNEVTIVSDLSILGLPTKEALVKPAVNDASPVTKPGQVVDTPVLTTTTKATANKSTSALGGIQVGGPSQDVWIVENEISGGARNGITLGNMIYLDENNNDSGTFVGTVTKLDDLCSRTASGGLPGTVTSGSTTTTVAAGGVIRNLHILRNRISNVGMCGIGPVGFFDLTSTKEIVSLTNVLIAENILIDTLIRELTLGLLGAAAYGYGVITLPDVSNLIVRDNIIGNYGVEPGAEVCGIYVYHGEGVQIGRNQIREARDLTGTKLTEWKTYGGKRAGIYIEHATPPLVDASADSPWLTSFGKLVPGKLEPIGSFRNSPLQYVPGLPALRIADNTVRVAYGLALYALGTGPFSILGNHLSTGGTVAANEDAVQGFDVAEPADGLSRIGTPAAALTVAIANMGLAMEFVDKLDSFLQVSKAGETVFGNTNNSLAAGNGTVQFSNNICQLMASLSEVQGFCSVGIVTLDHLQFTNNELWLNGSRITATTDALLFGLTTQAVANRLQESLNSVIHSGLSVGLANVTTQNISTYCLLSTAAKKLWLSHAGNVVLINKRCPDATP